MRLADLAIPAAPEFVSVARLVVSSVAADRYELSDDQLDDLKLAVSEACVVSMQDDPTKASVQVLCEGHPDRLHVIVGSAQSQFDAEALEGESMLMEAATPAPADLGLPLISTLVDEVQVESSEDGDRLRMTVFAERAEEL